MAGETGPTVYLTSKEISLGPDQYRVRLKDETIKPDYVARDGLTFCNYFVREIAHWFGYEGFDNSGERELSAHDFARVMERERNMPSDWLPLNTHMEAASFANHGRLVVAALQPIADEAHGHVCIVAPEVCQASPSWGGPVCQVANVGKDNWYGRRISWAFTLAQRDRLGLYLFVRTKA